MKITQTDLLLIIDPQLDFCKGGALAVPHGDEIMGLISNLAKLFQHVVITQDWHPSNHKSFASQHGVEPFTTVQLPYGPQVAWPDHCVQNLRGALLHPALDVLNARAIIRKGMNPDVDSYSAFYENDHMTSTGLAGFLTTLGIKRVFIVGLALDYCVRFSAEDSVREGFQTFVIEDATRGIAEDTIAAALDSFQKMHIEIIQSTDLN